MATILDLQKKMQQMWPHLNERSRRLVAAMEAVQLGYVGVSLMSRVCGISRPTIIKGIKELDAPPLPTDRTRHSGGGRKPLRDYQTVVGLIAGTTTAKGLTVTCRLDRRKYKTGRKVTLEEMATINITPMRIHGEWNYVIQPR